MSDSNENTSTTSSTPIKSFQQMEQFFSQITQRSLISMIWGETGIGKSSIAIQTAKYVMQKKNQKIFFLHTKQSTEFDLLTRILDMGEQDLEEYPFIFFHEKRLKTQQKCIFNWLLQIQQATQVSKTSPIGLIIIDEIMSAYLIEMRKIESSEKINRIMMSILSTLKKISIDYGIPIILINTFSVKENSQNDTLVATPHGGKLFDFWVDDEIKMTRSTTLRVISFEVTKDRVFKLLSHNWKWVLGPKGFQIRF
ncbi:MAG: DEAD/DEAH box helicase family protein [Promethearchaeota archaeon]